jgi:hypothetical protein
MTIGEQLCEEEAIDISFRENMLAQQACVFKKCCKKYKKKR